MSTQMQKLFWPYLHQYEIKNLELLSLFFFFFSLKSLLQESNKVIKPLDKFQDTTFHNQYVYNYCQNNDKKEANKTKSKVAHKVTDISRDTRDQNKSKTKSSWIQRICCFFVFFFSPWEVRTLFSGKKKTHTHTFDFYINIQQ